MCFHCTATSKSEWAEGGGYMCKRYFKDGIDTCCRMFGPMSDCEQALSLHSLVVSISFTITSHDETSIYL